MGPVVLRSGVVSLFALALLAGPAFASAELGPRTVQQLSESQARPLTLDLTRCLVRYREDSSDRERRAWRERGGLHSSTERPLGAGWSILRLPEATIDAQAMGTLITSALASEPIEFAAPLFVTGDESWIAPTQRIALRLRAASPAERAAVLEELASELQIAAHDVGSTPDEYLLRSSLRDGFAVLALANRYALDPRVTWAEPDWITSADGELVANDVSLVEPWANQGEDPEGIDGTCQAPAFEWFSSQSFGSFGKEVASPGDVNADGYDDILVAADIVSSIFARSGHDGSVLLQITGSGGAQWHVGLLGDRNGDGYDDVLIGKSNEGTKVFHGRPGPFPQVLSQPDLFIPGGGVDSVTGLGDTTGDDVPEIAISRNASIYLHDGIDGHVIASRLRIGVRERLRRLARDQLERRGTAGAQLPLGAS